MTALMSKAKTGELIPVAITDNLSFLLLRAQYLEAIEVPWYFQLGVNMEFFNVELPPV